MNRENLGDVECIYQVLFYDVLLRTSIRIENDLLENLDRLRNTQLSLAREKLTRKNSLLNLNYEILKLEKQYERFKILKKNDIVISEEQYETVEDQFI